MKLLTTQKPSFEISLDEETAPLSEEKFGALVLEAIDAALSTLGAASKQAVYSYLEKCSGVSRENIPNDIAGFACVLEKVFGQAAVILEARIMRELHCKVKEFKYFPSREEVSFVEYVENLRLFV